MSAVTITKYDEGPYVVQGDFKLLDGQGMPFGAGNTIALCRCGQSKNQPLCDGTHRVCGFKEPSAAR